MEGKERGGYGLVRKGEEELRDGIYTDYAVESVCGLCELFLEQEELSRGLM